MTGADLLKAFADENGISPSREVLSAPSTGIAHYTNEASLEAMYIAAAAGDPDIVGRMSSKTFDCAALKGSSWMTKVLTDRAERHAKGDVVGEKRFLWVTDTSIARAALAGLSSADRSILFRRMCGLYYPEPKRKVPDSVYKRLNTNYLLYFSLKESDSFFLVRPCVFSVPLPAAYCARSDDAADGYDLAWGRAAELGTGEPGWPEAILVVRTPEPVDDCEKFPTLTAVDLSRLQPPNTRRIKERLRLAITAIGLKSASGGLP